MAQVTDQISVTFDPIYNNKSFIIDDEIELDIDSSKTVVELFRCYISNVQLIAGTEVIFYESESYHLLDAEEIESFSFPLRIHESTAYDSIKFMIGIDSLTSVSGAMGGDLDPTKGMFWTWNTGYIFFKLEGTSPICTTRKNRFVYHLGGYDGLYAAQQWITLPVDSNNDIHISIDLDAYISKVDLASHPNLMSPGENACKYSKMLSSIFKIKN